uniref:Dr1-associated corepressor n=1 Tax=Schistosoma japonicum TaxID=6182 RepID=C1LK45_SCHJA|nr:Dr1-associated corepressor [Schistosoma japonicum]
MPAKRRFTSRFPTTRIKKIMQLDEEIGKLTATVPPVVSRSLEMFLEQLLNQAYEFAATRNSKTISPGIIKYVIEHEPQFTFLRSLVTDVPDLKPNSRKPSCSKFSADSDIQSDSSDATSSSVEEMNHSNISLSAKKHSRQKRKQSPNFHKVRKECSKKESNQISSSLNQNHESSLDLVSANKASKIRKNGNVGDPSNDAVPFQNFGIRNESLVDYQFTEA